MNAGLRTELLAMFTEDQAAVRAFLAGPQPGRRRRGGRRLAPAPAHHFTSHNDPFRFK